MTEFSQRLLNWYERSARSLPWRGSGDAYAIWVSEVMLQQTRVETVIPYYERWMKHFTSLLVLADAPEQEVLRYWEGLGYYSRARNLHRAAGKVKAEYGGIIPADRQALEKLPGVGKYTAGAIASIAFGLDEAALDGNIRRVLARVFNMDLPARSPQGERVLWSLARENLPPGKAGDYNQAIMDLGATLCLPQNPTCLLCPLLDLCQAYTLGLQEERPVMLQKPAVPLYTVTAAVIWREGQVLIARRPEKGLLGGMWEFPGGKVENSESLKECLVREIEEELGTQVKVGDELGIYRHAYTHFKVVLHAFSCELSVEDGETNPLQEPLALHASEIRWVLPEQFGDFPMGKIDRQIARKLQEMQK